MGSVNNLLGGWLAMHPSFLLEETRTFANEIILAQAWRTDDASPRTYRLLQCTENVWMKSAIDKTI